VFHSDGASALALSEGLRAFQWSNDEIRIDPVPPSSGFRRSELWVKLIPPVRSTTRSVASRRWFQNRFAWATKWRRRRSRNFYLAGSI